MAVLYGKTGNNQMEIIVNGESREIPNSYTVADLIEEMSLAGKRLAVEVNLEIVPRASHASHLFSDGDKVEVVHAIGGG